MSGPLDTSAVQALRESTGEDAEFLAELVATFLEDSPAQVAELRAATTTGTAGEVRRGAHTLKSNAATFGIVRLTDLCRELESRAADGNLDGAEELVSAIGDALSEARPALEELTTVDGAA